MSSTFQIKSKTPGFQTIPWLLWTLFTKGRRVWFQFCMGCVVLVLSKVVPVNTRVCNFAMFSLNSHTKYFAPRHIDLPSIMVSCSVTRVRFFFLAKLQRLGLIKLIKEFEKNLGHSLYDLSYTGWLTPKNRRFSSIFPYSQH